MNRIVIAERPHLAKLRQRSEKHFVQIKCMNRLIDVSLREEWPVEVEAPGSAVWKSDIKQTS
jgi:hypothetical protein